MIRHQSDQRLQLSPGNCYFNLKGRWRPLSQKICRFRAFTPHDLEDCISLYRQMVDHHREIYKDESIPYGDEEIRRKLQRTDKDYVKLVAEKNRQVMGLLTIEIKGKTCELDEIIVDKDIRGKGIGRAFLEYTKETALKRGCTEIQVSFAARNLRALKFYHSFGLNCLGMIQIFMPLSERARRWWNEEGKSTHFLGFDWYY